MIPVDSRFCSYCAADLRHELDPFQLGHDPEAETTILTNRHRAHHAGRSHRGRTQAQIGAQRSHRSLRRPLLVVAAILAISFIIARIISNATAPASPSGDDSGSAAPPAVMAPGGDAVADRLTALRQALDDNGYSAVQFRMNGDTLELWGTVPSEFDRVTVQAIVFKSTGLALLRDHLRVRSVYAEP